MSDEDTLLKELAQSFLDAGWNQLEHEMPSTIESEKIDILLDAGVEFITKLIAAHRTIHPLDDIDHKLEELLSDIRGGCFNTAYIFNEYVN